VCRLNEIQTKVPGIPNAPEKLTTVEVNIYNKTHTEVRHRLTTAVRLTGYRSPDLCSCADCHAGPP